MMNDSALQSRRRFIKTFTLLTATSSLLGKTWTNTVVAQLLPVGGVLRLKLSDFPALGTDYGTVRIGMNSPLVPAPGVSATCRKPRNTIPDLYPIIINRAPGNQFHALNSRCPHEDCTVSRLIPANASGILTCSGHGSQFLIDGTFVDESGPANGPLSIYEVNFDGADTLRITLPGVFFELSALGITPANTNRLALNFLASTNISYEVHFRETLASNSVVIPFTTTPTGTNATNSIGGIDDYITVYVERQTPSGFYSIAMRVSEV